MCFHAIPVPDLLDLVPCLAPIPEITVTGNNRSTKTNETTWEMPEEYRKYKEYEKNTFDDVQAKPSCVYVYMCIYISVETIHICLSDLLR